MIFLSAIIGGILFAVRGGPLKEWLGAGTQLSRFIWALPTAALIMDEANLTLLHGLALLVSTFLSLAIIGHGAHMIFDRGIIEKEHWLKNVPQVEMVTAWLPLAFDGSPRPWWPTWKLYLYHIIGMGFVGLCRCALMVSPLFFFGDNKLAAAIIIASGATHGLLYFASWRATPYGVRGGEFLTGAAMWAAIYGVLT